MKTATPAAILAHLRGETLTTALLWVVVKGDNTEIRATDHDEDITIPLVGSPAQGYEGTYHAASNITASQMRSTADLAADNMEVSGALDTDGVRMDVTVADVESGNLAMAPVTIYLCNWAAPQDGAMLVRRGYLGEIKRNSDGQYTTELRGLGSLLQQVFIRTFSERCQVRDFGDSECGVNVAAIARSGTVSAVTSRRIFTADVPGSPSISAGTFTFGLVTFTSGQNNGVVREIRRDDEGNVAGVIAIWDPTPYDIQVGDTFTLSPGCDRRMTTCQTRYGNVVNFRGYGVYIEGLDALMRGPT